MITKSFLNLHYVNLKKSSDQIGKECNLSGRTIRYHLTKFGFGKIMKQRQKTRIGIEPKNKGVHKPNPKSGRYYVNVRGKSIPRYRHIIEIYLGRKLNRKEIVHHIDGNSLNDDLKNLQVITQSKHIKIHKPKNRFGGGVK